MSKIQQQIAANAERQQQTQTEMDELRAFHWEILHAVQVLIDDSSADKHRIAALQQQAS